MNNQSAPDASTVPVIRTVSELRQQVRHWRAQGERVAMVPTMGALHHGHLSIVHLARKHADRVVVSIFVNPKQFGEGEDFDRYPRQEERDRKSLEEAATDLLYAPTVGEMYPEGFATTVSVTGVTEGLCGDVRPGHFDGVTTVVTKLLLQCLPDVALFGEKDYQQYLTLKHLVRDLDIPTEVMPAPIVRDMDGLATSSRNAYLTKEERSIALALPGTLRTIARALERGQDCATLLAAGIDRLRAAGFDTVDYLELRDAETLVLLDGLTAPARLLVAATVGRTRLIDNIAVTPGG